MGVTYGQLGIGPRGSHTYGALARDGRWRPTRKGQPPAASSQPASGYPRRTRKGLPPARATAPAAGVAAPWQF
ncbi:hypothetical protein GW17_00026022 [Ensete ventricosum]|nr:hypothetical protein GW17_00026022 [Ensete ventricosum]